MSSALFREICAEPGADETRLIYADWLTRRGDPRGDFIRAQVMLTALPRSDVRWPQLWAESQHGLLRHQAEWTAGLRWILGSTLSSLDGGVTFRRGFVETVSLWAPSPIEPLRMSMPLQCVRISEPPAHYALPEIRLYRNLGSRGGQVLLRRDWLPALRRLDLQESAIGVRNTQRLAQLKFGTLRDLGLRGASCKDNGVQAICGAEWFGGLSRLDVSANGLTAAALEWLSEAIHLDSLNLAANPALAGHLSDLGEAMGARTLSIGGAWQGQDARWIAEQLPRLRSLEMSSPKGKVSARQYAQLAKADMPALTELIMGNTRAGAALHPALAAMPAQMRRLGLRSNSLEDAAILALINAPITGLTELDLGSNRLTDKAAVHLAQWPALRYLTHLNLSNNRRIKDDGLKALMDSPYLNPVEIDLSGLVGQGPLLAPLKARFGAALRCEFA